MSLVIVHSGERRVPLFKPPHRQSELHLRWDRLLVLAFLLSFWTAVGAAMLKL